MKILQVNKFYHPQVGGIERVVKSIAEGLAGSHQTRVLASRIQGVGDRTRHAGVDVQKTSSLGVVMSVPIAPTFPYRLKEAARHADIVHHHLPNPLSVISELMYSSGDTPLVATYHSDIVRQKRSFKLYRPMLEQFLDHADRIIVTSEPLLHKSNIVGQFSDKCEVIPLAVELNAVDNENPPKLKLDVDRGGVVLFVGRLNYYKGVEYLIEAMEQVEGTLVVAGDGDRREALEARAKEFEVGDRVSFFGHVSNEVLGGLYQEADALALPSVERSEAFGIVQLEAMARGLPVVNTSLPTGVPWVSRHGETGLTVPPRDPTALANALGKLLSNESLRERYGRQARDRVESKFTRESMLEQVRTVYQKIT